MKIIFQNNKPIKIFYRNTIYEGKDFFSDFLSNLNQSFIIKNTIDYLFFLILLRKYINSKFRLPSEDKVKYILRKFTHLNSLSGWKNVKPSKKSYVSLRRYKLLINKLINSLYLLKLT